MKLRVPQVAIACAMMPCHQFYMRQSMQRRIGGALLSTLPIHLGYKLKQALNTKQQHEASTRSKARVEGSSELVRNIPIKWKSPSHGWVKISIDGAFNVKGN
ncbi:hypothetical protein PVK06_023465 [Gossypium arboreum]|uniref:Uncharacterized protein n=1 Tax=Gossypium arboreum TaxID=29729 RepID=A0ABR0PB63_GOSAR|nr:hypothetical protein PVK06_023465 [Gossypium arboreum]